MPPSVPACGELSLLFWQGRPAFLRISFQRDLESALRTGKARADAREKFVASFFQEKREEKRPPRGAAAFFRVVGQQADTRPVWASKVTTAPLFNRSVACSAPVMTGLSIAKPAMAAWEFAPLSSVMMPEQRRR